MYAPPPPPGMMGQPSGSPTPPESHTARNVAIVVIVVLVIGAVAFLVLASGTYTITLNSTHVAYTVSVTVTVDGGNSQTLTLGPLQSATISITLYGLTGCGTHTVSATSTGGGLGPQTDSANPSLCPGHTVGVDLDV